jgi:apolipoprotein N-acyltransferase
VKAPRVFVPAVLSGLLLWTAFFPLDLGPVAFVALVPFLTLVRADGVSAKKRYTAAFLGGLTFSVLALKWIRVAHPMMELFAWPALSLYVALYWPFALFLLRCMDTVPAGLGLPLMTGDPRDGGKRLPPLALTLPIVWVALEYLRANFPTGFPFLKWVGMYQSIGFGWYFLGYTQHRMLPLIQLADIGGVYLVSALVAAVNGMVYEWAMRSRVVRALFRWPGGWVPATFYREFTVTAVVVLAVSLALVYGSYRLAAHPKFAPGPLVAALQGNLPQNEKMMREGTTPGEGPPLQREYFPLMWKAVGDGNARVPDLIIWPETCFPDMWDEPDPGLPTDASTAHLRKLIAGNQNYVLRKVQEKLPPIATLLGMNRLEWTTEDHARKFNSAILFQANGKESGHYDKMHLVPFGEYVPLKDWLPWLQAFTPYKHDYSCTPGNSFTRFELPSANGKTYRFGVLICYEDSDPALARRYNSFSGDEPPANFLVNTSNDGWFDGTEEHEQHLAICRFRAVEARRAVVRAVNMGISAVIDGDGKVVALPESTWEASKKMSGVVRAEVPIDDRDSVYAAAGDWVPGLCWLLLVVAHFVTRQHRRRTAPAS